MKSRRVTRLRYQLECWILLRNVPIFGSTGKAKKPGQEPIAKVHVQVHVIR